MSVRVIARPNTHIYEKNVEKALASPARVSIIEALRHGDLSVSELADMLRMDERLVAYHLKRLVRAQAITEQVRGSNITYAVMNPAVAETGRVLYQLWAEAAVGADRHGSSLLRV